MKDLIIRVTGAVQESNLELFKEMALAEFDKVNKDLQTDDDFAEAKLVVKRCKEIEVAISKAKEDILNQSSDIRAVVETLDEIFNKSRETRLFLDKKVTKAENDKKEELIKAGIDKVALYIQEAIQGPRIDDLSGLLVVACDNIRGAIKGKKTISGMQGAIDIVTEWNIDKINEEKKLIITNLVEMERQEEAYPSLFPDKRALCTKPSPELAAIIQGRVATYKLQQAEKERREKEKIEKEEAGKDVKAQEENIGTADLGRKHVSGPGALTENQPTETANLSVNRYDYNITLSILCNREDAISFAKDVQEFSGGYGFVENISLKPA